MEIIDWAFLLGVLVIIFATVMAVRKYVQNIADFLVVGRSAGRYILSISGGIAGVGVISFIASSELIYMQGFSPTWWALVTSPVALVIALSGWVVYRYRQTRVLTVGQFFELRYHKSLRIFTAILRFLSGVINFGIFPAIGCRFFVYFLDLPQSVSFAGVSIPTFSVIMAALLMIAVVVVCIGGHVAAISTNLFLGYSLQHPVCCNLDRYV